MSNIEQFFIFLREKDNTNSVYILNKFQKRLLERNTKGITAILESTDGASEIQKVNLKLFKLEGENLWLKSVLAFDKSDYSSEEFETDSEEVTGDHDDSESGIPRIAI